MKEASVTREAVITRPPAEPGTQYYAGCTGAIQEDVRTLAHKILYV